MNDHGAQGDEGGPHHDVGVGHPELEQLRLVATVIGVRTMVFSQSGAGIITVSLFDGIVESFRQTPWSLLQLPGQEV